MEIWFDMDGTIADLYGVENWLEFLENEDTTPYDVAEPLIEPRILKRELKTLQDNGFKIGIITWLSKYGSEKYNKEVSISKMNWLKTNFNNFDFDEIHILKYGTPKEKYKTRNSILFDDELKNRENWGKGSYDETRIMEVLKRL